MRYEMIEARECAGHSRNQAAVEIGCSLSTLYQLERYDKMPRTKLIQDAIKKYIRKNKPKEENT